MSIPKTLPVLLRRPLAPAGGASDTAAAFGDVSRRFGLVETTTTTRVTTHRETQRVPEGEKEVEPTAKGPPETANQTDDNHSRPDK